MKRDTSLTLVWYLFDSHLKEFTFTYTIVLSPKTFAGDRRSPQMAVWVKNPNLVLGLSRGGPTWLPAKSVHRSWLKGTWIWGRRWRLIDFVSGHYDQYDHPSVHAYEGPSVRPSIRPSVRPLAFKWNRRERRFRPARRIAITRPGLFFHFFYFLKLERKK